MSERRLREELLDARVPDAAGAEERGWRLVRAAYVGLAAAAEAAAAGSVAAAPGRSRSRSAWSRR